MKTPIERILKKLKMTEYQLSKELELAVPSVYKWSYKEGARKGAIPVKYHKDIMKLARRKKVKLVPADFVAL